MVDQLLNPFLANVPILYPLKTPENQRFSGVFRWYKMGTLVRIGLIKLQPCSHNPPFYQKSRAHLSAESSNILTDKPP